MAEVDESRWWTRQRWWAKEGDDLARTLWELATSLETDQGYYRRRAVEMLSMYNGSKSPGDGTTYNGLGSHTLQARLQELDYNLSRAACDTVHAEIAGRQKPAPKFQTSDADWKTKRRAKKMEKYVRAILQQRQGRYLNAWELMENGFLDACIWGMGAIKVFAANGRINLERHFSHELFVDPMESVYGEPQNLFHVYLMERDKAIFTFALDPELDISDERRREIIDAIEKSEDVEPEQYGQNPRVARMIKVVEAWRLKHPGSEGKPGKHAFAINNKLLYEEDWDRSEFPFVFIRWEPDRIGWQAKGLIEQGETIHKEVNENAIKLQERFRLCGAKRTYIEAGSCDVEDLQANDAEVIVQLKKGAQMPNETVPKPIAEAEAMWLNSNVDRYFELTGVSQMRSAARKEPGVTAGVAIRTLNDMQTARFALKAKAYENAYVDLTNQIIYCAREAAEDGDEMVVRWNEEIQWADVELPEDTFDITIAPTSSLPNDPAGRMQMTQELYSAGIIQQETFKQLLGWPDLEKEMNHQTAQTRWLEKVIDRILDDAENYEPPDAHIMDKGRALLQVSQAYFDALYDDAPEDSLAMLRDYMMELDQMIMKAQQAAAEIQMQMQAQLMQQQEAAEGQAPEPGMGNRPPVAQETVDVA